MDTTEVLKVLKDLLSEAEDLHELENQYRSDEGCGPVSEDISLVNARALIAKLEGR